MKIEKITKSNINIIDILHIFFIIMEIKNLK
jgi:hypothetical protein